MALLICSGFWDHLSSSPTGRGQVKDKHGCLTSQWQLKFHWNCWLLRTSCWVLPAKRSGPALRPFNSAGCTKARAQLNRHCGKPGRWQPSANRLPDQAQGTMFPSHAFIPAALQGPVSQSWSTWDHLCLVLLFACWSDTLSSAPLSQGCIYDSFCHPEIWVGKWAALNQGQHALVLWAVVGWQIIIFILSDIGRLCVTRIHEP